MIYIISKKFFCLKIVIFYLFTPLFICSKCLILVMVEPQSIIGTLDMKQVYILN